MEKGLIKVEPFDLAKLGTNSYDVHLGKTLAMYNDDIIDAKSHNKITTFEIPLNPQTSETVVYGFANESAMKLNMTPRSSLFD